MWKMARIRDHIATTLCLGACGVVWALHHLQALGAAALSRTHLDELDALLWQNRTWLESEGSTYVADNDGDSDEARVLRPLQAAACTYRIAFGPRAGQKVLTLQCAMPRDADFKQRLCADNNGFSLHAAVRCGADER